jgi:hypothetical protein
MGESIFSDGGIPDDPTYPVGRLMASSALGTPNGTLVEPPPVRLRLDVFADRQPHGTSYAALRTAGWC